MSDSSFDDLSKSLARGMSRRAALRRLGSGMLGVMLASLPGVAGAARPAACPTGVRCKGECCPPGMICVKGKNGGCVCPAGEELVPVYPGNPNQVCCPVEANYPVQCSPPAGSGGNTNACCPPGTTDCLCDADASGTVTCTCCDCSAGGGCTCVFDASGNRTCECPGCVCTTGNKALG